MQSVKKTETNIDKTGVTKVCIDDFALRRRFRYGTIMVNIDTDRVIDMLESRASADVAAWLATYPNIQLVSRDGSLEYAKAINMAHPNAIQVSDRFHLIKHLSEYAAQHIKRVVGARFRIGLEGVKGNAGGGYWDMPERNGPDLPERQHMASTEKRAAVVARVRELAAKGLTIEQVKAETGLGFYPVKKYLDEAFDPEWTHYGVSHPSKLDPYADTIDSMLRERRTFREVEETIRQMGYTGASSTIRMYATRQRKRLRAAAEKALANTELIERKWLTKLLYLPIERVKGITEEQLERIIREYPVIGQIYDAQRTFKEIVFSKRVHELDAWIEDTVLLGLDEMTSFCNGLKKDLDAVKNAIRYDYNNGLAEGSINKLKLLKRIMYGRHSFILLKNKLLYKENLKAIQLTLE